MTDPISNFELDTTSKRTSVNTFLPGVIKNIIDPTVVIAAVKADAKETKNPSFESLNTMSLN